jgi:hypothetical protein
MEVCEDLIERVKLYGISQYLDNEAAVSKLRQNWCVRESDNQTIDTALVNANGLFSGCVAYLFTNASNLLYKLGVFGVA